METQISPEFKRELESEVKRLMEQKPNPELVSSGKYISASKKQAADAFTSVKVGTHGLDGWNLAQAHKATQALQEAMNLLVALEANILFETTGRSYR